MSNFPRPMAVVLAFDVNDYRQNEISAAIRANFAELIKLQPAERRARIDEILKPERTNVRS